ncbi:MAG: hypothetical protein EOP49_09810 [Sphingobacteriales bacterium]|nr:MAG: hypothetical protein EOP49_09810 [Sphingobacteriales bacterium]
MKGAQNQLERFRSIAKKLVDDHSAELFTRDGIRASGRETIVDDAYFNHLDVLGRELNEQAVQFLGSFRSVNDEVKTEIWDVCKRYIDQFAKRNQPSIF